MFHRELRQSSSAIRSLPALRHDKGPDIDIHFSIHHLFRATTASNVSLSPIIEPRLTWARRSHVNPHPKGRRSSQDSLELDAVTVEDMNSHISNGQWELNPEFSAKTFGVGGQ